MDYSTSSVFLIAQNVATKLKSELAYFELV